MAALISGATLTSDTGEVVSATWDASLLGTADGSAAELRVVRIRSGGNPNNRRTVEVGAAEWNAKLDAPAASVSELYFLRAQYYDPGTGRFIGRDPLEFGQRYGYARNNPMWHTDPLGLCGWRDPWDCARWAMVENIGVSSFRWL
jgi:RHS repeat-associated protein